MDNAIYATLTRQSGLMRELRSVANNIANADTSGFRREGVVFSAHMTALDQRGGTLSMANAHGREIDLRPAALTQTGGTWDLGLEGDGFFMVATPQGNRLTRAGAFMPDAEGQIMTPDGHPLLDDGQAPIMVPPGTNSVGVGPDGTVSADGQPIARVGTFAPGQAEMLRHDGGTLFSADGATPIEGATIRQGFQENSNVDPVLEIARMVEVQRAYELGQSFLQSEDQRIRDAITALTR